MTKQKTNSELQEKGEAVSDHKADMLELETRYSGQINSLQLSLRQTLSQLKDKTRECERLKYQMDTAINSYQTSFYNPLNNPALNNNDNDNIETLQIVPKKSNYMNSKTNKKQFKKYNQSPIKKK